MKKTDYLLKLTERILLEYPGLTDPQIIKALIRKTSTKPLDDIDILYVKNMYIGLNKINFI